jgi:hypothetical protein
MESSVSKLLREPPKLLFAEGVEAITAKVAELGGRLGAPVGEVKLVDVPHRVVCAQNLEQATVYWSAKTGAREVHGNIRDKWAALGGAGGFLGLPLSDEIPAYAGVGRLNDFEHGAIFWHPDVGAHEVHGAIRATWDAIGGTAGFGYPITDELPCADGVGRFSVFARQTPDLPEPELDPQTGLLDRTAADVAAMPSAIYWHPEFGAWPIRDRVYRMWLDLGDERGFLGYPTGSPPEGTRFQRGTIESAPLVCVPDTRIIDTGPIHLPGGVAANGRAKLMINSAGEWVFSGKARATGAPSYDVMVVLALDYLGADGKARAFVERGDIEGTLVLGGNRDHTWEHKGSDPWIADNWDELAGCGYRASLKVDFGPGDLLAMVATIVGVPVAIVGAAVVAALGAIWFDKNVDSCTSYDANGNPKVDFVPKGQLCPDGTMPQRPPPPRDN